MAGLFLYSFFTLSENLSAAIVKAGKRIGEFHLSDNHGQYEEHLLPYAGSIDWKLFAKAVCAIDYKGSFIIEAGATPSESYQVAKRLLQELEIWRKDEKGQSSEGQSSVRGDKGEMGDCYERDDKKNFNEV